MRVQHCRLLRSSTTQHSLGSSSYPESAAVWANISTKQWKPCHRVQSSGNGRQPWKRNDYQAVNEGDKGSASPFWALGLLLVRAAVVTYRCPRAVISTAKAALGMPRALTCPQAPRTQKALSLALPIAVPFTSPGISQDRQPGWQTQPV